MNNCVEDNSHILVDNKVRSFFVRTLCSYEPYLDKGLPGKGLKFKPGDLLLVTNANDSQWWQAAHIHRNMFLSSSGNSNTLSNLSKDRGLIPSLERVKNKSKSQKRHVDFDARAVVIGPTGKLLSEMISTSGCSSFDLKRLRKLNSRRPMAKIVGGEEIENNFKNPYEIVEQKIVKSPRPVVVIGPGKDEVYEHLLLENPDKFTIPIPHTTRPARPGEVNGVDYHFIKNREELENESSSDKYIDIGKFKGNLYANSIDSVKQSIDKNKHPLLDISHNGIEKLRCANIYPICILISSSSLSIAKILQGDNHQGTLDIQSTRDYTLKLEKEFSVLFDVIISPLSVQEMKEQVIKLINAYQRSPTWITASNQSYLKVSFD